MAEQKVHPLSAEALDKLKEQLTCSICLDQYVNAKILPCFHSFCLSCLGGVPLVLTEGNYSLPCPTCRSSCSVTQQGVAALPSSFTINNLTEVYNLLKKVSTSQHTSCDKCSKADADRYCKQCGKFLCRRCLQQHDRWVTDHLTLAFDELVDAAYQLPQAKPGIASNCTDHSRPLEIFCESCEELICQLCTVKKHKDHEYDVVCDVYAKHKLMIQSCLQPLTQEIDCVAEAISNLIKRRDEITEQGEKAKETTHLTIVQIKELLDNAEKALREDINTAMKVKLNVIDDQVQNTKIILDQLTECRDYIQRSLEVGTPHQILSTKSQMTNRSKGLLKSIKEKIFQPLEKADIVLVKSDDKAVKEIANYVGKINYTSMASSIELSITFNDTPLVDKESNIMMSLALVDGTPAHFPDNLINCHLVPPNTSTSVLCTVEGTSVTGQYTVEFTPLTRGPHLLHVIVYDHIASSKVTVPVSVPAKMRNTVIKTIGGLKKPTSVAVSENGQLIIAEEKGHSVIVANKEGAVLHSFSVDTGTIENDVSNPCSPHGVALTSAGTILVADVGNNCIQEFTMDGDCISHVGCTGSDPLQFNVPRDIAVNKVTGQMYIADCFNHRVQVLNADFTFSHTFGSHGFDNGGEFDKVSGIAIDSQGFVYVADSGNNRIQTFSPEGQFISLFGSKGTEPGQLTFPHDVAFDDQNLLYICEGAPNSRISVFTLSGDFVHCFGEDIISYPYGSVFDKYSGCLYVCDSNFNSIKVF